mgnify:CR=1 FL=1
MGKTQVQYVVTDLYLSRYSRYPDFEDEANEEHHRHHSNIFIIYIDIKYQNVE